MNAREEILNAIRKNKPDAAPVPVIPVFQQPDNDLVKNFEETILKIGGAFKILNTANELRSYLDEIYPAKKIVVSNVNGYESTLLSSSVTHASQLEEVDLAVLTGDMAVAESASIWISDKAIPFRALPFICQHLVLVFAADDLVYNMHQAYQLINISESDYGVFIAGPSKTADIEQSLVIGAHGPRSMTAIMLAE